MRISTVSIVFSTIDFSVRYLTSFLCHIAGWGASFFTTGSSWEWSWPCLEGILFSNLYDEVYKTSWESRLGTWGHPQLDRYPLTILLDLKLYQIGAHSQVCTLFPSKPFKISLTLSCNAGIILEDLMMWWIYIEICTPIQKYNNINGWRIVLTEEEAKCEPKIWRYNGIWKMPFPKKIDRETRKFR